MSKEEGSEFELVEGESQDEDQDDGSLGDRWRYVNRAKTIKAVKTVGLGLGLWARPN